MFQFISLGGSYSFLHLGTVQERYHKEKDLFFFQGPTVLTPGTWTNCRLIILWRYVVQMLCGMTRFGLFVIGALWISTPKMYKLRCLYYTFWPQIGSNYSASSFEFVINSFCFLECRESPKCFHIPLKACTKGLLTLIRGKHFHWFKRYTHLSLPFSISYILLEISIFLNCNCV